MSNKFDAYDDNDEITLSSSANTESKTELKKEITRLKTQLKELEKTIEDYTEIINKNNVKDINLGNNDINSDQLQSIMANSSIKVT